MGTEAMISLDDIFDKFLKNKDLIFKNRELLSHNYVPNKLYHREEQYNAIINAMINGFHIGNSLIICYGKAGTGKTSLIISILNKITLKCKEIGTSDIITTYVNCRQTTTKYRILTQLTHESGLTVPKKYNFDKLFQYFKNKIESKKQFIIIVLDEIDKIISKNKNTNHISNLLEKMNNQFKKTRFCIISLSNDLNFKTYLSKKLLSNLNIKLVYFQPYNEKELEHILNKRINCSFYPGVVTKKILYMIADIAAITGGDARYALNLLLKAGEIAERNSSPLISEFYVKKIHKLLKNKNKDCF
ncbi:MAG: Cdc6/Cdc18 family protein [Candidatus Helarchaeota archaeon]